MTGARLCRRPAVRHAGSDRAPHRGAGRLHDVLADTVGFVRDLPHDLVAAFRSTLSEAREADFLLHVVDAADPHRGRIAQVDEVLTAVGAGDLPQLLVFNKIDRIDGADVRHDGQDGIPDESRRERVWISARDGQGLELLQAVLGEAPGLQHVTGELRLPRMQRLRAPAPAGGDPQRAGR